MTLRVEHGDCLEVIPRLVAEGVTVDAVVTDPPYHLKFMNQKWDGGDVAFRPETWATVATIMRPGAFLVAFGGTRTYHRLVCAIEDAGFVIQDQIAWLFGNGWPKHKAQLKPAQECIAVAQKPWVPIEHLDEAGVGIEPICLAYKPGGKRTMQVDECRVAPVNRADIDQQMRCVGFNKSYSNGETGIALKGSADGSLRHRDRAEFDPTKGRWPANVALSPNGGEYELRPGVTAEQRSELYRWLSENP